MKNIIYPIDLDLLNRIESLKKTNLALEQINHNINEIDKIIDNHNQCCIIM